MTTHHCCIWAPSSSFCRKARQKGTQHTACAISLLKHSPYRVQRAGSVLRLAPAQCYSLVQCRNWKRGFNNCPTTAKSRSLTIMAMRQMFNRFCMSRRQQSHSHKMRQVRAVRCLCFSTRTKKEPCFNNSKTKQKIVASSRLTKSTAKQTCFFSFRLLSRHSFHTDTVLLSENTGA